MPARLYLGRTCAAGPGENPTTNDPSTARSLWVAVTVYTPCGWPGKLYHDHLAAPSSPTRIRRSTTTLSGWVTWITMSCCGVNPPTPMTTASLFVVVQG